MKIALIYAKWHLDLVQQAVAACETALKKAGYVDTQLLRFEVPGSLEIPLLAQKCIQTGDYVAVIALGLVVDGGIYHHEFVAQAVLDGFMRVQLDTGVPIFSCVMTPQHFDEAEPETVAFFKNHMVIKGEEAANACLEFLAVSKSL